MKLNMWMEDDAFPPIREHPTDAGLDLRAKRGVTKKNLVVPAHGYSTIPTGIHIEIPNGYVGLLLSKSGLNANHGITSMGVIDSGYTGEIQVMLHNSSDVDFQASAGMKLTQLVIMPIIESPDLNLLNEEQFKGRKVAARGDNGFGSTGYFVSNTGITIRS